MVSSLKCLLLLPLLFCEVIVSAQTNVTIRPSIARLVSKLERGKEVHFGYPVGISGKLETNNKYYRLYNKLERKATTDELVSLTRAKSNCVLIYSFSILQNRGYENLKEIFIDHISDTTFFWTAGGCTGWVDRVNWFMLRRLRPIKEEGFKSYLTQEEYDLYCDRFQKEDKQFSWQ